MSQIDSERGYLAAIGQAASQSVEWLPLDVPEGMFACFRDGIRECIQYVISRDELRIRFDGLTANGLWHVEYAISGGEAEKNPDCDERISLRAQARKELTRMALQ